MICIAWCLESMTRSISGRMNERDAYIGRCHVRLVVDAVHVNQHFLLERYPLIEEGPGGVEVT